MTLGIMLLTYSPSPDHPRATYARKTLESALTHIRYDGRIIVHVADDGSHPDHVVNLIGYASKHLAVSQSNSERAGYGRNYNLATQALHSRCDYVLPLEDDWVLDRPLDLNPHIQLLREYEALGCVRFGYLGHTQPLFGAVLSHRGHDYLVLDPDSPEPHVFAGHPRLESVTWQRRVGPWPEGLAPGATEVAVTKIRAAREGVVWPMDCPKFAHIGTVKSTEED